ncbi:hypothetical protein CK203_012814 [Vitis vinifera]|uniref:NB-ARC domain-containing protein n=1 Tax=Vitis vinifera TaxID=29760 RepID=A0A438JLT7_VITVI|nr:hypothetical protein CK203_012814 [Vitis vinifera]
MELVCASSHFEEKKGISIVGHQRKEWGKEEGFSFKGGESWAVESKQIIFLLFGAQGLPLPLVSTQREKSCDKKKWQKAVLRCGFKMHVRRKNQAVGGADQRVKKKKKETKEIGEAKLGRKLCEFLKHKKCLVVVDDAWSSLRNDEIALRATNSQAFIRNLGFMDKDESWQLFLKKTFGGRRSFCIWASRRPDKAAAQRAGVDAPLPEGCGFKAHIRRKNQAVGESD